MADTQNYLQLEFINCSILHHVFYLKNSMKKFHFFCLSLFAFFSHLLGSRMGPWPNYLPSYNRDQCTVDAPNNCNPLSQLIYFYDHSLVSWIW